MRHIRAIELLMAASLAALAAAWVPLHTGYLAWSWDALNHHVYLGLIAGGGRWHLDVLAASYQSYQYPYLYWPVYHIGLMHGSGAMFGALWSGMQAAMLALPMWIITRHMLPDAGQYWQGLVHRSIAFVLAFASVMVFTGLETTGNDVLAAVPVLWALALALNPQGGDKSAVFAAALWGVSVAFKLSNGLFLPLLLVFWWTPSKPHWPWRRGVAVALASVCGFGLAYAPWGFQLWAATGNPFYPYFSSFFVARSCPC
jgi:hypothetical protein